MSVLDEYAARVAVEPHPDAGSYAFLIARNPRGGWRAPRWRGVVRSYFRRSDFLIEGGFEPTGWIVLGPLHGVSRRTLVWGLRCQMRSNAEIVPKRIPVFVVAWKDTRG